MPLDRRLFIKVFSPRMVTRALLSFDRSTAVVVSVSWLAAFIILILAAYTVHSAVAAKRLAADAKVAEPILPVSTMTALTPHEGQVMLDRLQHQFPEIKFELEGNKSMTIKTQDGAKFHQWITAISYVDAMEPQFRWTLFDFCVGHCGQELMRANLVGQKIMFSLPQRQ